MFQILALDIENNSISISQPQIKNLNIIYFANQDKSMSICICEYCNSKLNIEIATSEKVICKLDWRYRI